MRVTVEFGPLSGAVKLGLGLVQSDADGQQAIPRLCQK